MGNSLFNRLKKLSGILVFTFFLFPMKALAVEETQVQDKRGVDIVPGVTITTVDAVFGTPGWSNQTAYSVSNIVYFEIDFNNQANKFFYSQTFTASITVDIDVYNNPNNPNTISNTYSGINLEVNYNPTLGAVYKGLASYKFNGAYKVIVRVNNAISATGINPVDYPIFKLTNQLTVTRQYNFVDNTTDITQYTTDGKKLNIRWTPTNYKGAEMFDVEWTFVDEFSLAGQTLGSLSGTIPASQLAPHFRNNSGRSTVTGNTYQFNLNYNSGYLLYRIRGVQFRHTDGIRMEGNWNYTGAILPGSLPNLYSCAVVSVKWHEYDLNWQYQAAFAEDGKKKEIISYFDGSQRSRQTVTLNNSDNVSVVAEPVYDAQGRAAMNILPAPVVDNELKYYRLFNLNNNLKPVSHLDIPIANCGIIAAPLNQSSGVERYFSSNNPFQNNPNEPWHNAIPASKGFPFSVTQYTADNTGRIRAQGSVGDTFQLGTDHETKYFYGKPSQYELDRLFGADAGEHNHYLKNMVVDPNGQVSVSYVNSAGKTVATGLAGVVPVNLEPLATATPPTSTIHDVILTPSSFQINNANKSLEATTTLLVSSGGDYKFTYKFTPEMYKEAYNNGQDTLCYTCVYDLLVTVKNECGDVMASKTESGIPLFDTTCTPPTPIKDSFLVTFSKVGEYSVYFELKVNEQALDSATQHYLVNNTDILTLNHFLLEQLIEENLAECYSDCDACKALPETVEDFILKVKAFYIRENLPFNAPEIEFATQLYDSIKHNCITYFSNCVSNPCDDILEVLKADVTPGGQYAEFDIDYNLIDPAINVLVHYTQVNFTDEQGVAALVENENGVMVPPSSLSLKEFIEKFEESWADSLVKFHPEFCYYEWCDKNSNSQSFNQKIEDLVDAEEAIDLGFFVRTNPSALLNADPFFASGGYGFPYKTQMQNDLNLYSQNVLQINTLPVKNIFETIDFLLYCGPATPAVDWANCNIAPNAPCRSIYKEWLLYSEWYLDRKHKYYTAALKANNPNCINCFIPSSAPMDPNVIAGCVAPSVSSFTVDTIPGSSVDGIKRIRINYLGGNQVPQWPLNVQLTMYSSSTSQSVTQSVIFIPGFGSQELMVQDEFDSFIITAVACAQLTDGNRTARSPRISLDQKLKKRSNIDRVFNRLETSIDKKNQLNAIQNLAGKSGSVILKDWACPKFEDFEISGIETPNLTICYRGVPIPSGHSVSLTIAVTVICNNGQQTYQYYYLDFCSGQDICKNLNFPRDCIVTSVDFTDLNCDRVICEETQWECPTKLAYYTVGYQYLPGISNWELTVCYTGPTIPPGKSISVDVHVVSGCTSFIETFVFCSDNIQCKSKVYSAREVCDRIQDAVIKHVECQNKECTWECPTNPSNYTVNYQQNTNGDFVITTCYTGAPIPAGNRVIVTVAVLTGCGATITYEVTFCSGTPTCHTRIISNSDACEGIRSVSIKDVKCDEELCKWECPTNPSNYTVNYQQNTNGDFVITTCYTGAPIPPGNRVIVTVAVLTGCGTTITYEVTFCSGTPTCHTRIISNSDACEGIRSLDIKDVKCDEEPCKWECPTNPSNYTVNYLQNTNGDFVITTCYTGAPIPAGNRVIVTVAVLTGCGATITYEVTFCSGTPTCHTRIILNSEACEGIRSLDIKDVKCDEEPCKWECPTNSSNYTINYQQNINGDFVITTCYTGAPIPAGNRVIVRVAVLTGCGTTITYEVTFCSGTPTCHTRIISNSDACEGIRSVSIKDVKCDEELCKWECPTDSSNYTVNYQQNTNGDFVITTCYTGAPIPAGNRVIVRVAVLTGCGTTITYEVTFCSGTSTCHTRIISNSDACEGIRSVSIKDVKCDEESCEWECPVDSSNYNVTKTYKVLKNSWEVKICYTGPAIPFNKTVIVPVTITSPCSNKPIRYNIRFCQAITCNTYIVPNARACNGNFVVTLGQISCEDSPCSGECPDSTDFSVALNTQVTCTPVSGSNIANIRITHDPGPLALQPPMGRVKVTIAISTSRILFGILPETVEKTIFLHNGDSFKDYCFQFGLNRKIDSIKIIKTECLGPCATGDCCDDPRYELYTGKDRRFQDYIEPNFNAIMTSYQSGSTNFGGYPINYCKNECETMADAWVQDLSRCLGSNPQRLERVRRGLIDVCQQSCMAQSGNPTIHPFSDLNPAPSFESVIVAEFGPITDTCAYDLISDPYPWGKVPIIDRTFATETNTAICYRLNTLRAEAQSNGYTNDVDRVHDYLTAFYQPYYDLIKEELQDLFTGCYDCNGIMPIPVELPAFMDGNAKPCFTCDQFDVLIQQFNTKYPGVTPATDTYEILFKNFVNHQTGYSHAFANYYDFMEKCSLNVNSYRDTGRICETPQVMEVEIDLIAQCMDEKFQNALSNATNIYNAYIDSVIRAFRNNYTSKCLEAKIWLETDAKLYEYHYTLYYYDQAGNLVKTVPPKGVEFLTPANISLLWANRNNYIVPAHTLATIYEYNSFNQVVRQKTPDAGISEFWYDRLGRLTVSQNSEQKTPSNGGSINRYSYTKYEPILGRIKEVGEKTGAGNIASINTRSNTQLLSWLSSGTDIQITETIYDKADLTRVANSNITNEQYHFTSRNRVVATLYSKVKYADPNLHDAATHYSYDINGNAKTIWQENERLKEADPTTEGLKRMDYEFDLISGKVNRVFYQKSKGDQFIYRYKYDAENRITEALTSRDGILWQTDASYKYYLHGPLARTEIGTHKVQGVDLAYTLQGWMKFMNAPVMNVAADIGRDGNTQIPNNIFSRVSRDAYGYGISYYENDFKAIGQNSPINLAEIVPNGMGTGKNLFNGNIRATTLQIKHLGDPVTYSYSYDQLNRLVKMRQHQTAYTAPAGSTAAALAIANPTSEYKENIRYDANGNIMDYLRNGTTANSNPLEMDDMRYEYYANTNKLRRVHDPVPSGNYGEDIDQQINANNYKYDNIGNLISDAAENISSIKWNVYGKISRIMKSDANNTVIEYEYDATGNRIYKKVTSAGQEKYTYYIKDAQGNSMALYIRTDAGVVEWGEQHLYGSSRLGVRRFGMPVPAGAPLPAAGATMEGMFEYGRSQYELSNHLGNVLATITDKKVGIELGTTGTVEYFEADVATANDYYPFGMTMPGRKYSSSSSTYRYGFNGKENDKEVMGEANFQDYGLRMYNVRLGRFISVDPLTPEYPELTPYQFASNTPISAIDLDGGEAKVVTYGVKMKADDNFVKTCGTACARALGVKPEGISTGKNLLTVLRTASSGSSQNISAWANFGHSWNSGLYLTNDNGFYKGGLAAGGAGTANFNDLLSQSSKGQISFSKHSLFIFASCGTAGDGAGGHGAGKGAYSSASFAASIGNYVNKNYILPNGAFTGTYKITTIGATDLSNLHTDGTVTTDGTFIKTENTYQIERKVITETKTTGWWIFSKTKTTTRYEDKTTLTGTKTTDLGKKINPAEVIKNHNDQDTKTP